MKRMIPAFLFCGMFALLAAVGCDGGAKDADVKVDKATMEIKPGAEAEAKVTAGKADKVESSDAKAVTAAVAGDKITVKADKEAKDGDVTLTVKGAKGTATIKVTVKK